MGKKNFEQLVKEAGILVAKASIREKKGKIEEAAIAKFVKSTRYQAEVRKARMEQKKQDAARMQQQKICKMATQMENPMKKTTEFQRPVCLEQFLPPQVKGSHEPELRPKWLIK